MDRAEAWEPAPSLSQAINAAATPLGVFDAAAQLFEAQLHYTSGASNDTSTMGVRSDDTSMGMRGSHPQDGLTGDLLALSLCAALSDPLRSPSQVLSQHSLASSPSMSLTASARSQVTDLSTHSTSAGSHVQPAHRFLAPAWSAHSSAVGPPLARSHSATLPPTHRRTRRAVRASHSMQQLGELLPSAQQQQQQQLLQLLLQEYAAWGPELNPAQAPWPGQQQQQQRRSQQPDTLSAQAAQIQDDVMMRLSAVDRDLLAFQQQQQQSVLERQQGQLQHQLSTQGSTDLSDILLRELQLLGQDGQMQPGAPLNCAADPVQARLRQQQQQQQQTLAWQLPSMSLPEAYASGDAPQSLPSGQPPHKRPRQLVPPFCRQGDSGPQHQGLRPHQGSLLVPQPQGDMLQGRSSVLVDKADTLRRLQDALRRCSNREMLSTAAGAGC